MYMQNDDLGQFPQPPKATDTTPPVVPTDDTTLSPEPDTTSTTPTVPSFEETPAEIPSLYTQTEPQPEPLPLTDESTPPPVLSDTMSNISSPFVPKETETTPEPTPAVTPAPEPTPATLPASSGVNMRSILFVFVFLLAVISVAGAAFFFQRTLSLQQQLRELTDTLKNRTVTITPTPTPTTFEFPTPSVASISAAPTASPTATPTLSVYEPGTPLRPLSVVNKIMQIALKHQPNAQLILIKTENAQDTLRTSTKYFFRQDLTTKKYFYILVSGKNEPQIFDKNIFVTPDNNIPSLNDLVLTNKLGLDLDEALSLAINSCATSTICATAPANAQYIQTTSGVIWQLSLKLNSQKDPAVIQIDAQTRAILFKTTDFK